MRSTLGETRRPFEQSPTWPPNDVFLERDLEICVEENNFALNTKTRKVWHSYFHSTCLSLALLPRGEEGERSVLPLSEYTIFTND